MTSDPPVRPPAGPPPAEPSTPETASPAPAAAPPATAPPATDGAPPAPAAAAPPAPAAAALPATDGASPAAQNPSAAGPPILDQVFDADSLYALRAAVAAHGSAAGLSPARADDLVIAVHELAANAVRHGAGHGRLRVWRADGSLLCEISDDGTPPPDGDPSHAEPNRAARWPADPGHGLSLVRLVADQTSLVSGQDGTQATILFALAPAEPRFRLDQRRLDRCTVVAVTGPLDMSSAGQLTETVDALLADTHDLCLILDLAALTGWDSVGLAALVAARQQIGATPSARLVLAALPEHLRRGLAESGLAAGFSLAATAAAAVTMLS